jgi:hypothetical protein
MLSGRKMCRYLHSSGIDVQKVIRRRQTGDYLASFYTPDFMADIAPACIWAERMQQAVPAIRIIATQDVAAPWRTDCPIICATVIFQLAEQHAA